MSKHQKTIRRERRKEDRSRRQRSRLRGFFNPQSAIRIPKSVAALAAASAIAAGTAAYADQVRFDNPPHGEPGHFHWPAATAFDATLDVTLPASEQPADLYAGAPVLAHLVPPGSFSSVYMYPAAGGIQEVYGFAVAIAPGEMMPSEGATCLGGYSCSYYGDPWCIGQSAYVVYPGYGSCLPEGQPTYLGVAFGSFCQYYGNCQFGWVGVMRNGSELEAFAWGYETELGVPVPVGAGGGCTDNTDCDDEDACTEDVCDTESGECSNDAIVCDDANVCNGQESCDSAVGCVEGTPLECDDANVCNGAETCDPVDGCQSGEPLACDDGQFCNGEESCDAAVGCLPGEAACAEDQECDEDNDACVTPASLIIKQGSCPAPVNTSGNGVVPMVLAGDSGFAAGTAVPGSLELRRCDGAGGVATPLAKHTKLKDLNHPADADVQCGECACNDDQSSDGITDLSLKFATNDLVAAGLIAFGDGQVTLELTGELADGTPFVARDCVGVLGAGEVQTANATVASNVDLALIGVTPMDLNADTDGFGNFARAYEVGTQVTLTAPSTAAGRRFTGWSVDGVLQPRGQRSIELIVGTDTEVKAFYRRQPRVTPNRPTEDDGNLD